MNKTLADELRELRHGHTLREVEAATGVSNAYLSQLEMGTAKNPSIGVLASLAAFYGVSTQRLVDFVAPQTTESDAMKTANEVKPNYGPIYAAALYPELAQIFVSHGYALAVHGSLARDFDLIAVPWIDKPSEPQSILNEIERKFAVRFLGEWTDKPHGRRAITMTIGFGWCAGDLSFMPITKG